MTCTSQPRHAVQDMLTLTGLLAGRGTAPVEFRWLRPGGETLVMPRATPFEVLTMRLTGMGCGKNLRWGVVMCASPQPQARWHVVLTARLTGHLCFAQVPLVDGAQLPLLPAAQPAAARLHVTAGHLLWPLAPVGFTCCQFLS